MEKQSKLQLLSAVFSLLILRDENLNSSVYKKENDAFFQALKSNYLNIDSKMLEFLYCYIYYYYLDLNDSIMEYDDKKHQINISSYKRSRSGDTYKRDVIELIDDEELPIKMTSSYAFVERDSDVAQVSNEITYYNSKAMEMIKLKSGEKPVPFVIEGLDKLLDMSTRLPKRTALYRTEENFNTINELRRDIYNKPVVTTRPVDKACIYSLEPEYRLHTMVRSDNDIAIKKDEPMPFIAKEYLQAKEEASIGTTETVDTNVDDDIMKMIMQLDNGIDSRTLSDFERTI